LSSLSVFGGREFSHMNQNYLLFYDTKVTGKALPPLMPTRIVSIAFVSSKVLIVKAQCNLIPSSNKLLVSLKTENCCCSLVWIAITLKQINKLWDY
jgi:hypothetical protein